MKFLAGLSNSIEDFLNKLLDDNEGIVELRRNELANDFNCSPSQINYVLQTRFQPTMGYYIESRRGGGGYIKIERVEIEVHDGFLEELLDSIGDSITLNASEQIIDILSTYSIIDKKEENLLKAAMEERALDIKGQDRNVLRATLLRNMLLAVFKEIDYEE